MMTLGDFLVWCFLGAIILAALKGWGILLLLVTLLVLPASADAWCKRLPMDKYDSTPPSQYCEAGQVYNGKTF